MSRLWAAVRFLTVFPLPRGWGEDADVLGRAVPFFPFVGMLIGLLAGVCVLGGEALLPDPVLAVLAVVILMAASGGMHMDGLSDAADGLFSARPKGRMLEIMRDSHIGAMGVMAIVSVFGLKVAALAGLSPDARWRCVCLMPVAGRCALVWSMGLLPYARPEGGLGSLFYGRRSRWAGLWALVVFGAVSWGLDGPGGLAAVGASAGVTLVVALYVFRKIGGATGDTLGAACECAECACAMGFVLWERFG